MDLVLHKLGQIVDLMEETHPQIVGVVVLLQFCQVVVLAFLVGLGHTLLEFGHRLYIL